MVLSPNLLNMGWKKDRIIGKIRAFITCMKHVKCLVEPHWNWYISNMNAIKINQANVGKFTTSYHGPCWKKTLGFHPRIKGPIFFWVSGVIRFTTQNLKQFFFRQNKTVIMGVINPKPGTKYPNFRKHDFGPQKHTFPHPPLRKQSLLVLLGGISFNPGR